MHFNDPALQYSFQLPLGWAYDWEKSHLITVTFRRWDKRDESLSVRAMPTFTSPDASLDDWYAALDEQAFPPRMRPEDRIRAGSYPAALVESHDPDPEPVHRRIMIVRGTRLDAVIEHRTPEVSTGSRLSEVIRTIGESLTVPTNQFLPEFLEQEAVIRDRDLAAQALQGEAWAEAIEPAFRALKAAQGTYLYTLVNNTPLPEIPAILVQINTLFMLAQATGSILFLRNAEHLAMRALYTLEHLPFVIPERRHQLRHELLQGLQAISSLQLSIIGMQGENSNIRPSPGIGIASLRSNFLAEKSHEIHKQGESALALILCEAAVSDLLMVISELPKRFEAIDEEKLDEKLNPDLIKKLRACGATTPEQMKELELQLCTHSKLDDLGRVVGMLSELRGFSDDHVGASEASQFLSSILKQFDKPPELSFGGSINPPQDLLRRRIRSLIGYASSLVDVGDAQSLGEAHRKLKKAEKQLDTLKEEGALRAYLCLVRASILHAERKLEGALATIKRGLQAAASEPQITQRTVMELKTIQSQFLIHTGDIEEAERVAQEVVSSPSGDAPRDIQNRASHYLNLGIIYIEKNDWQDAIESLKQALHRAVNVAPFSESAYRILIVSSKLFNSYLNEQQDKLLAHRLNLAALANLDARFASISSDSARIGFDETILHRHSYEDLISRLIEEENWDEAASVADRSRARSLNFLIAPPSADKPAFQMASKAPQNLTEMEPKVAFREASEYILAQANAQLSQQGVFNPLETQDLKILVHKLGSPCLLIQPVNELVALIVCQPDGEIQGTYSPKSLGELLDLQQQTRISLQEETQEYKELLSELWLGLIAPISDLIGQTEPLMIVPYRELALLPFALLQDRSGISLIEHRPISVTPSLATLRHLQAKGDWNRSHPIKAYIAGDPAFNPNFRFQRLPAAKEEAKAVATTLGAVMKLDGQPLLRLDAEANEESYRKEARGCDLVHLSCHADLKEKPAYESRLILAPFGQQDGLLMAAEATDVRLNDALVFLGACQTGLGRVTADGVVGLGRAFLEAGARAVILSQWSVQDQATSALAIHFYESLLNSEKQFSAAQALQQAMLKTREDLQAGRIVVEGRPLDDHPRYWAPFFILGDGFTIRYSFRD